MTTAENVARPARRAPKAKALAAIRDANDRAEMARRDLAAAEADATQGTLDFLAAGGTPDEMAVAFPLLSDRP